MKNRSSSIKVSVAVAVAVASAWSVAAADMDSDSGNAGSIYVNGAAGIAIMQNMTAEGSVIQYNVGPKVDLSAGYNVSQNIAIELQSGFAYNSWSSLDGHSLSSAGASADLWTVPVLANGIYKYSFNDHWQAYGGLGAGVVISSLSLSLPGVSASDTDCEFGYQAQLGIKYLLNDHMSVGLGYSFLGTLDHHWTLQGAGLTTSPTYLHSILLSLSYKF